MMSNAIINDHFIYAVVWTIIHSLWQSGIIALIMSLTLKLYQNSNSSLRYNIALSSLMLVFLSSVMTFAYYYVQPNSADTTHASYHIILQQNFIPHTGQNLFQTISSFINTHKAIIFITWTAGFALFSTKFAISLGYVTFLSKTYTPLYCQDTYQSFMSICRHFNIQNKLKIGESKYIQTPVITGLLNPVILFPIGVINQLDIRETEAIIAHELAHFVRKDIIVNIIQTMIESLFYYNPAVWWISANIRLERENACDDMAVAYLGNNLLYAKTLLKMQELNNHMVPADLILNFSKTDSFFSNRIKRILKMTQTRNYLKEKVTTSLILLFTVLFISKNATGNPLPAGTDQVQKTIHFTVTDTLPQHRESIRIQKKSNDRDVNISMENGKVTELEIDGKKIEEKDFGKYSDIIAEMQPKSKHQGQTKMYFFGSEDGKPIEFLFGNGISFDSIMSGFHIQDFASPDVFRRMEPFNGSQGFGNFGFGDEKWEEHWKKVQEKLGKMPFEFKGLDDMDIRIDSFAMPSWDWWGNQPGIKIFEFGQDDKSVMPKQWNFNDDSTSEFEPIDKNFSETIGYSLNRDGLLLPDQNNKIELTGKYLKINGEKQPSNIHQKYKRIFEESSGTVLQKKSKLEFNFMGKHSKRKYRVY